MKKLISTETAHKLDTTMAQAWGLNAFALVEAAGRLCAKALIEHVPSLWSAPARVVVLAGSGNNGADAMVMLRALIIAGKASAESAIIINRFPPETADTPQTANFLTLTKMTVPSFIWDKSVLRILKNADIIIDGIVGTGLSGPLNGTLKEMVLAVAQMKCCLVSIDIPSGLYEEWRPDSPVVPATFTLAIEPLKGMLYRPSYRRFSGEIIPISGIFPELLINTLPGNELLSWEDSQKHIAKIMPDAYKYDRGVVEIHAGAAGSAGAARIAARGAQAAGAGLVRTIVDDSLYPIVASPADGIMVVPASNLDKRFTPHALLLGPGWGIKPDRQAVIQEALTQEEAGVPLILDADGLFLTRSSVFHGNAILTPHLGEASAIAGTPREEILADPEYFALKLASAKNATIIIKGHVIVIADPKGTVAYLDGMLPVLATGGSGDLLAGFCAALAARMYRNHSFDGYTVASASAALLIAAACATGKRFIDPLELADTAAALAGKAWL
ncbi:MAG: bifunctional ADP-dependent NAD(P)H-hydrate dehydratase/NAD(P)H-hydrate epimerase [Spirochaetaceae bacterium]|jgi:NAD(P)H-hydrate epimerase|nr:bifunctional ADP-dependent NAD(P)H-hydrate dehydratase/NAD(P)H-hydrate epimerase [Spirochaetaceae bacterium]